MNLSYNNLTELTENNLKALCYLNNIKPNELTSLFLNSNKLNNINFIIKNTPFINLKVLWLNNNEIDDINNIQYLKNLRLLNIKNLNLNNEKQSINILKTLNKLEKLYCKGTFKEYTYEQLEKELPNIDIYNI